MWSKILTTSTATAIAIINSVQANEEQLTSRTVASRLFYWNS